ncbi:ATP-binding cassette sub-family A member 3 [Eufriesea mexicana]|uniref:ATP-binding cassette sub-family A member 3 n=1 Tax=Eufriesea mexicana TaxID=516756 RepID=A0A310SHV5_9HYME|nr:ATP-binding cassette sub-family A member 3 [Eufriesea mexicana]
MANKMRTLSLLLYKNLLVRRRHWKTTIFLQCLIPIILFILTQYVRDFLMRPLYVINRNSYYPIEMKEELTVINSDFNFVYYAPDNSYTKSIFKNIRMCLKLQREMVIGFSSEDDMINAYTKLQVKYPTIKVIGLVFEQYNTTDIRYKIRHTFKIPYKLFQNYFYDPERNSHNIYLSNVPFVQLQICVDETVINHKATYSMMNTKMSIQQMPYPPYVHTYRIDISLGYMMCIVAVIAFLFPLCVETNYATKEKIMGINVLMAMNGVKPYQNLLSWLIAGIVFSIFYIIPMIILFKNAFFPNVDPYLYYSNTFIFWLILTAHVAHLISFGMHVAAYFSKPRFVITILLIIYNVAIMLHINLEKEEAFSVIPYLGILFPNVLLYRFFQETNAYELQLTGIQWSNIFFAGETQYDTTGCNGFIFIFSILGTLLHFSLTVYINAVHPGKYGIRKSPFYFLKFLKKNKVNLDEDIEDFDYDNINNDSLELVGRSAFTPGIQIRNIKKTYKSICFRKFAVQALKGISMDLYKGQITALLGHNGAGKTTLMSIVTGVTSATEGKVLINGKNITKDLQSIRNDLGLCPQENMVFPDLSVFEQLEFFGLLKGKNKTRKNVRETVNVLLNKLKMSEKRNVLPSTLSAGQLRRLCLGMALIGDASTIILDEPTSGMDPETRRVIWDIMLKIRGKKTILISTHNMEEADILADQIAIIHEGRLKCYGTPMFLKRQYGYGHIEVTLSTKSWCNADQIINNFDPRTQQISVDSKKIVLSVPNTETLPLSLDKVDSQKNNLGITGISVSLITLEEVFLKKNLWNTLLTLFLSLLSVVFMGLSCDMPHDSTDVFPLELSMYRHPKAFYSSTNETIGTEYKNSIQYFGGFAKATEENISVTQALLDRAVRDIAEYRNNYIVSAEFNTSGEVLYANGFYSGLATHSIPLTVNLLSNTLIKSMVGEEYSIHISSQKFPTDVYTMTLYIPEHEPLLRVFVFCCFFFSTVALFAIHPLQETKTKIKQLQRMTGVTSFSYWLTMFTFDFLVLAVSILIIILGFYFMDIMLDIRLYYKIEILIVALLLLLFGMNSLFISYIFSFVNKSRNTIITTLSILPSGFVLLQYILHQLIHSFNNLRVLHSIHKRLLGLIPHVSLFQGLFSFFNVALQNMRCRRLPNQLLDAFCLNFSDMCCDLDCADGVCKNQVSYFSDNDRDMSLKECITFLCLTPFIYFAILIILEERLPQIFYAKMRNKNLKYACNIEDGQVKKEKDRVALEIRKLKNRGAARNINEDRSRTVPMIHNNFSENPENNSDNLCLVHELSKYYGNMMAVKEINFQIKSGECIGLLGVNGAGKSTMFRMLTGEELPNNGTMYFGNLEIQTNRIHYLGQMGYCPQTDALLNSLNAFDHLRLFALLRGIPESKVDLEVNKWINRLNLNACMHRASGTYSGGYKRCLSIAIALIGNPTLILLDEPTTGVDPVARRSLWNILQSCQTMGQAIILTSHSMEEYEALCNRLVIMVKGQSVCIGAIPELKQRFGAGYDIYVKLNPNRKADDVRIIKWIIESSLPCEIRDENLGLIAYHVRDIGTTWENMYSTMNKLKRQFSCIEDYSVLSATLEQLFIQIATGMYSNNNK